MQLLGKNTRIDISGHKATVVRIEKGGVVCQLEGNREVTIDFDQFETALDNEDSTTRNERRGQK